MFRYTSQQNQETRQEILLTSTVMLKFIYFSNIVVLVKHVYSCIQEFLTRSNKYKYK